VVREQRRAVTTIFRLGAVLVVTWQNFVARTGRDHGLAAGIGVLVTAYTYAERLA